MFRKLLMLSLLMAAALQAQQDFVVVVQKANSNTSISRAQLKRMLMGELTTWPSGEKVTVIIGPAGSPSRAAALKAICGMSESDYAKHTLQANFEGGARPVPRSMPSDSAVKQIVQLTRGAVGIVEAGDVDASLRVLEIR